MKRILFYVSGYFLIISSMLFLTATYSLCHKDSCAVSLDETTIISLFSAGALLLLTAIGLFFKQDFARKLGLVFSCLILLLFPVSLLWGNVSLPLTIMPKYVFYIIVLIFQILIPISLIYFFMKPDIKSIFLPFPLKLEKYCPFVPTILNKSKYSILLCIISLFFFIQMGSNIFLLSEIGVKEVFFAGIVLNDVNAFVLVQTFIILGFLASAGIYKKSKLGWLSGLTLNIILLLGSLLNMIFATPEQVSIMMPPFPLLDGQAMNINELLVEYRRQMASQLIIPGILFVYLLIKRAIFINPFIEWKKK